ncbi:MAG: prepilin peptidase, partial [Elusimicrobiaceae bacterium]|nr:prepilin peptidase [Elusimicrobiaceae bacterium]
APASSCPTCEYKIKWYDNIPIISYFLLKARCRDCDTWISFRYPLVEILAALFAVLVFNKLGINLWSVTILAVIYMFIVGSFIDFEHRIIPDGFSIALLIVGLATCTINPHFDGGLYSLWQSFLGAFIGFFGVWLIAYVGEKVFKKECMGGGDIKIMAGIGALLGWEGVIIALVLSSFFGLLWIIGLILAKKIDEDNSIAFGPFLFLGAIVQFFVFRGLYEFSIFMQNFITL